MFRRLRRPLARWRSRAHRLGEQWSTWRHEWGVERDLERALSGQRPILAGPWLSEVGYEVLYWVPFLRWVTRAYRIPPERLIVMSRGGTHSWYRDFASRYVEVFDHVKPVNLSARASAGSLKQRDTSDDDDRLVRRAVEGLGVHDVNVLHPSLMFRWFAPFWSGQEAIGFVERHTRHSRIVAPAIDLPIVLPRDYVAVKFYAARSLPDTPLVRQQLRSLVSSLAEYAPIIQLDTGLGLDDHADYRFGGDERVISLDGRLDPRTNLAIQTRIIAGARLFVGTCGSLAWLAPLLGVRTVPVFSDDAFLHAHLHVARRVFDRVDAGGFAPVDVSGLQEAGLVIGRSEGVALGSRVS